MINETGGFFTTHRDIISGVASIAGVISLTFAAIALFRNAVQVRRNTQVSQASAIYKIQKDAREMAQLLLQDDKLAKDILSREITHDDRVLAAVGQLFNFYAAVFQQKRLEVLDDQLWRPIKVEMGAFLGTARAQQFWNVKKSKGEYDSEFTALVDEIVSNLTQATSELTNGGVSNSDGD